jgi:hypothetical protein
MFRIRRRPSQPATQESRPLHPLLVFARPYVLAATFIAAAVAVAGLGFQLIERAQWIAADDVPAWVTAPDLPGDGQIAIGAYGGRVFLADATEPARDGMILTLVAGRGGPYEVEVYQPDGELLLAFAMRTERAEELPLPRLAPGRYRIVARAPWRPDQSATLTITAP